MRFLFFLFLLLSLSSISIGHPVGDLSIRHRRSDEEALKQPGTSKDTGGKCYFSERRTSHENVPRMKQFEVSTNCGGTLLSMSDLFTVTGINLYQCPNYPALILTRGAGEFEINWAKTDEVKAVGERLICAHHVAELGWNWEAKQYYHYPRKDRPHKTPVVSDPVCSMRLFDIQHANEPEVLHTEIHYIEADEARAILKKHGTLIAPGLPVCAAHNDAARKVLAEVTMESTGMDIHSSPTGQHPSMVSMDDPEYVPPRREIPTNADFVPPPKFSPASKTAYETLMQSLGLDPLIATKKNWDDLNERTKRKKAEALSMVSDAIAHFMAPQAPMELKEMAWKGTASCNRPRPAIHSEMMEHVKGAFESAPTRAERMAALAMASHLSLSDIQQYIPGLSRYYLNEARKYARRGYHLVTFPHRRMKYHPKRVDKYLEFVTSYRITLNEPCGTREVKDSYGQWIEIPNMIRTMRAVEIYLLYKKWLADNNELDHLIPESIHKKILRVCSAERRRSLRGVDIIIADAMDAFDQASVRIEKLKDKDWINNIRHGNLRSGMLGSRQYLRTDFLVHGKEHSTTGDHCWRFGLSDPDEPLFQVDCDKKDAPSKHAHTLTCQQCESVHAWFRDMKDTAKELLETHKNDKTAAHQLRTAKSENDRQLIVAGLKKNEAMITLDWAMKAMPFNPRESTSDWYGQRGMPWHIGHVLAFDGDDYWQHHYVHLFHGTRQDSVAVTAIIRNIFEQLAAIQIRRCYKSSSTIASIKSIADEVGIEVVGWYFSEAQAGKGPCDRGAAVCKGDVHAYADSGLPVTTPEQFLLAVTHNKLIRPGYSYQVVRLEGSKEGTEALMSDTKIPDLSKYNAFTFEKDALRVHRFWNIGLGKKIPYTNFHPNDARLVVKGHGGAEHGEEFWAKLGEPREKKSHVEEQKEKEAREAEEQDEDEDSVCKKEDFGKILYRCPEDYCAKEFLSEKNLEKHVTVDKHLKREKVYNVVDYALHHFTGFVETVFPPRMCPMINEAAKSLAGDIESEEQQLMGWALPRRKRSTPFPRTVKSFLRKIYDEGARTGEKVDARKAEQMMRDATKPDGSMMFELDDLLSSRQIAGVYAGFKKTTLEKRGKIGHSNPKKQKLNEEEGKEEEVDEVNQLMDTEGDEELEYETEPLFDEQEGMRRDIAAKEKEIFDDVDD